MPTIISSNRGLVVPVAAAARPMAQSHQAPGCRSLDSRGAVTHVAPVLRRHQAAPPAAPARATITTIGTQTGRPPWSSSGAKVLLTFSALLTSGEASSEGSPQPPPRRSCSPTRMHFAFAFAFALACFDALRASPPWRFFFAGSRRQPPSSCSAGRATAASGALVSSTASPTPTGCVGLLPSAALVACFVGALVAGAGLLCTGAEPRARVGTAVLPGERQEAAIRHAGPDRRPRRVGPLAGLAVGPVEAPVGIGRRGVHARVALRRVLARGRRTLARAAAYVSPKPAAGKTLSRRPARTTRVAALLTPPPRPLKSTTTLTPDARAQSRRCRARGEADQPGRRDECHGDQAGQT